MLPRILGLAPEQGRRVLGMDVNPISQGLEEIHRAREPRHHAKLELASVRLNPLHPRRGTKNLPVKLCDVLRVAALTFALLAVLLLVGPRGDSPVLRAM